LRYKGKKGITRLKAFSLHFLRYCEEKKKWWVSLLFNLSSLFIFILNKRKFLSLLYFSLLFLYSLFLFNQTDWYRLNYISRIGVLVLFLTFQGKTNFIFKKLWLVASAQTQVWGCFATETNGGLTKQSSLQVRVVYHQFVFTIETKQMCIHSNIHIIPSFYIFTLDNHYDAINWPQTLFQTYTYCLPVNTVEPHKTHACVKAPFNSFSTQDSMFYDHLIYIWIKMRYSHLNPTYCMFDSLWVW